MHCKHLLVGLLSLSLLLSSCATLHNVPLPAAAPTLPDIHRGDRVVLVLRNGEQHDLTVESVGPDQLMGREKGAAAAAFAYADLQSVQVYRRGAWARAGITTLVVAGVVVVAAGVALLRYIKDDRRSD